MAALLPGKRPGHHASVGWPVPLLAQANEPLKTATKELAQSLTVVVGHNGLARAQKLTVLLLERLSEPFWQGSEVDHLSGSIGITLCPNDATDSETLVKQVSCNHGQGCLFSRPVPANEFEDLFAAQSAQALPTAWK